MNTSSNEILHERLHIKVVRFPDAYIKRGVYVNQSTKKNLKQIWYQNPQISYKNWKKRHKKILPHPRKNYRNIYIFNGSMLVTLQRCLYKSSLLKTTELSYLALHHALKSCLHLPLHPEACNGWGVFSKLDCNWATFGFLWEERNFVMKLHMSIFKEDEQQYLTNDAQSLLGPGDSHIYLVGNANKAQMFGQPSSIWFILDRFRWQRAHCWYDDVTPFTSYKTKHCMSHDKTLLDNRVKVCL